MLKMSYFPSCQIKIFQKQCKINLKLRNLNLGIQVMKLGGNNNNNHIFIYSISSTFLSASYVGTNILLTKTFWDGTITVLILWIQPLKHREIQVTQLVTEGAKVSINPDFWVCALIRTLFQISRTTEQLILFFVFDYFKLFGYYSISKTVGSNRLKLLA